MSRKTVARINLDAIRQNLDVVRKLAPDSEVAAVVKADAYGHGLSHVLSALGQADLLSVASSDGAQRCRDLGWRGRVLMLEGPANDDDCRVAVSLNCEMVVHHESQFEWLRNNPSASALPLWLKIDSGMSRLGFPLSRVQETHAELTSITGSEPAVLMSHFACADDPSNPGTKQQMEAFDHAVDGLRGYVSLANSAAVLNFPESHRDIVRPGIMLYGISPSPGVAAADIGLTPAMTLQAELIAIKEVGAGQSVGYGGHDVLERDALIGVAAIGYGDGYPRSLGSGTPVLVNQQRAELFGPISMDLTTIDLSRLPDVRVGDVVTLWGEGLPVEDIATWAGTIPYELVCGVTARVRTVVED